MGTPSAYIRTSLPHVSSIVFQSNPFPGQLEDSLVRAYAPTEGPCATLFDRKTFVTTERETDRSRYPVSELANKKTRKVRQPDHLSDRQKQNFSSNFLSFHLYSIRACKLDMTLEYTTRSGQASRPPNRYGRMQPSMGLSQAMTSWSRESAEQSYDGATNADTRYE